MGPRMPDPLDPPAPTSTLDALDGAMRRRGLRIDITLTPSAGIRAHAHVSGMLDHTRGIGVGPTLREALGALVRDLTDKGA